jgi:hypothetical protein
MIPHILLPWSAKENAMSRRGRFSTSQRKRCDAFNKSRMRLDKNGRLRAASPRCRAWAMENGRCRMHGGASTGPKSPEGKARVVAAMVAGRRAWVERQRAEGKKLPGGRKSGEAWITEAMRECATAEAHRLGSGIRFTHSRALTLALLQSAKGCPIGKVAATALLVAEMHQAIENDVERASAIVLEMRATLRENRGLEMTHVLSRGQAAGQFPMRG